MIDNPAQVERLLAKLQAALPVPTRLRPEAAALLQARNAVAGEIPPACSITWVSYAGDEGGIMCGLDFGHETEPAVVTSITHLRFDPRLALAGDITAYQKRRVKRLQRQGN
jgi:hypothetical protein